MINELLLRVDYNDETYDLLVDNEVPLRIDMSAVESQELGKFFGIGSQTFSLPGTKETNRFFNYAYDVSTDDIPGFYNTLECSVILNGETVLIGALQLVQVISNDEGYVTYQVQVVDKVLQFEEALASKLIKNADFSAYNHTLTAANVLASWDDALVGGDVYYPVVDYGRTESDLNYQAAPVFQLTPISGSIIQGGFIGDIASPAQLKQFQPAIKMKSVLDVIFDQVGFSYTGSFTESDEFNSLYVLNKPNEGLGVGSGVPTTFLAQLTNNQLIDSVSFSTPSRTWTLHTGEEISDPSNSYNPATWVYTVPETGNYTFNSSIYFTNPASPSANVTVTLAIYSPSLGAYQAFSSVDLSSSDPSLQTLSLSWNYGVNDGVELETRVILAYNGGGGTSNTMTILDNSATFFSQTEGPVTYEGVTVDMSQQWPPETKSIDIVRGLLQQFNLVMIPEVGNKSVVRIEQFDDWIRSGDIKDWTSKYDTAKRIAINHTVDELPKEVFFKAENDFDRFSKATIESDPGYQYGTLRALAENNISQGTSDISSYFAPVILGGAVNFSKPGGGGETFYSGEYPLNLSTTFVLPHLYKFENNSQVSYSSKPRLGFKVQGEIPTGQSIFIQNGTSYIQTTGTYSTIGNVSSLPVIGGITPDLHFNNTYTTFTNAGLNLNGGVSNFNSYWKTYYDSLYWEGSKKVVLDLFFNEYEYKDIQLNDRILIKGQAYRINKIKGFNVSHRDVVTVELIRLYPAYWALGSGTNPIPTPPPIDPCDCIETGSCAAHTVYSGGGDNNQACNQTAGPLTLYTDNSTFKDSVFIFSNCATQAYTYASNEPLNKDGYNISTQGSGCENIIGTGVLCSSSGSFTYASSIDNICSSVTNLTLYASGSFALRNDSNQPVYSNVGLTTPATDGYYKYGSMILRVVSGNIVMTDISDPYNTLTSNIGYCEYPCLYS